MKTTSKFITALGVTVALLLSPHAEAKKHKPSVHKSHSSKTHKAKKKVTKNKKTHRGYASASDYLGKGKKKKKAKHSKYE
jgi:Flp pilus assembly protein TadB